MQKYTQGAPVKSLVIPIITEGLGLEKTLQPIKFQPTLIRLHHATWP